MNLDLESPNDYGWYAEFRSSLERIRDEFATVAEAGPNLYHRVFYSPDDPLESAAWQAFIESHRDPSGWEYWEQANDGSKCGCYFGEEQTFQRFLRLAESAFLLLLNIKCQVDRNLPVPTGVDLTLPRLEGHSAWLDLLYDSADFGAPLLRNRLGFWKLPNANTEDDILQPYVNTVHLARKQRCPAHPFFRELQHDIFLSSREAIDLWLMADQAVSVGEWVDELPIQLPPLRLRESREVSYFDLSIGIDEEPQADLLPSPVSEVGELKPTWDAKLMQLRYGTEIIRQYKQPATSQTDLLSAFQDKGWPSSIDDHYSIVDVKSDAEALARKDYRRNLVSKINMGQRGETQIRFSCDRTGRGIKWDLVKHSTDSKER
jgi:hypothetical protein